MILLGLIFNFCGTLALLFAQPHFNYDEQCGTINADIKSEKKQKILWRGGFGLLSIGFVFQAIPYFHQ
jgi:hypothetical protein